MTSLRDRIQSAEIAAFFDPELPRLLLLEPDARWWWMGAAEVAARCVRRLSDRLRSLGRVADVRKVLDEWTYSILKSKAPYIHPNKKKFAILTMLSVEARMWPRTMRRRTVCRLALARRLAALLPVVPAETAALLRVLEANVRH